MTPLGQSDSWRAVQSPEDRIEMLGVQIRRLEAALHVQVTKLRYHEQRATPEALQEAQRLGQIAADTGPPTPWGPRPNG